MCKNCVLFTYYQDGGFAFGIDGRSWFFGGAVSVVTLDWKRHACCPPKELRPSSNESLKAPLVEVIPNGLWYNPFVTSGTAGLWLGVGVWILKTSPSSPTKRPNAKTFALVNTLYEVMVTGK